MTLAPKLREGADLFNSGKYWHAHEAWEEAWHALKREGRATDADAVQGLILVTAAFENRERNKKEGFTRQLANGLRRVRAGRARLEGLGFAGMAEFAEALVDLHLGSTSALDWDAWRARGERPPPLRVE